MRKDLVVASIALAFLSSPATAAPFTTHTTDFNSFTNGTVNGQGGWAVGTPSGGVFDQAVVDLGGGNKALRLSNKFSSGEFDTQPFAPRPAGIPSNTLTNPTNGQASLFAGESSTGAAYNTFIGSFDFQAVNPAFEAGARITISPDNGDGARQGFLALQSTATGIQVQTTNVVGTSFNFTPLSTVSFDQQWHNLRYEISFNDGLANDVAKIYLDNALLTTVNSWESFYAAPPSSFGQSDLHPLGVPAQTLLFRLSSDPLNFGGTGTSVTNGFYIDNVSVQLDNVSAVPEPGEWAMMLAGLAIVSGLAKRRKSKQLEQLV
jgi:hypothetical protein